MYSVSKYVFYTTLILYVLTLLTVSYVGVYLTYVAIPVIVVSGYTENEEQALALGIEDVIVKPFNPDVAKLRVANAVKLRSMHE